MRNWTKHRSDVLFLSLLASFAVIGCSEEVDDDTTFSDDLVQDVSWQVHEEIGSLIVVSWEQSAGAVVHVEFQIDDEWLASPSRDLDEGTHQELLLGVPYDHDVTFRVLAAPATGDTWTGDEQVAHTDEAPQGVFTSSLLTSDPSGSEPTLNYVVLALAGSRGWTVIVDRSARLVWASQTPPMFTSLYSRLSHDGTDILVDHNSYWQAFDDGAASQVQRLKIDGTVVATYDTPGLHHPFTELADGSIVWPAVSGNTENVKKRTPAGDIESLWSCQDFHQDVGIQNYCGSNTLTWNEADDTFLLSLYSDETIVEFDHATGQTLRYFGHAPGGWQFDPPESAFYWQHGGHFTAAGTLLTSSHATGNSDECVVREYSLDETNEVLHEVWNFGVGLGVAGDAMGEVHRLPGGNTLHNYGTGARLREVTPDGTVVWDVQWAGYPDLGRTTPLEDLYDLAP
jgi:hypothetical protein